MSPDERRRKFLVARTRCCACRHDRTLHRDACSIPACRCTSWCRRTGMFNT